MDLWLRDIVAEAGRLALSYHHSGQFEVRQKADGSPVTTVDLAVDELLHRRIIERFPDDCILSEETKDDPKRLEASRVWILDPIDGTSYLVRREPEFSILAALCIDGVNVESVAYFPALELMLYARLGEGCFLNGRPVRMSQEDGPRARVGVRGARFAHLDTLGRPLGHAALELLRVAAGEFEGCVLSIGGSGGEHDYAWLPCVIEEAGGVVTDGEGLPLRFNKVDRSLPSAIVAANPRVHAALLEKL